AGQPATNHEGGIKPRFGENRRHHGGGGGLAVGTGHGDAVAKAHQFGQHFRARHHRHAPGVGFGHFHVTGINRRGGHHHVGVLDVLRPMADGHPHAQVTQAFHHRRFPQVAAADGVTLVGQHFGDPAHANTADADEMDTTD